MKILDRYIFFKYLSTFFYCLIMFTVLVIVIDMSEHADDFARTGLTASQLIKQYWIGFIPRLDAMLFPLFVFISVIFFTSKMAGRSEVIAILSSGVTYRRYLMPFIAAGLLLSVTLWLGYRYVVPPANRIFGEYYKKYMDNRNTVDLEKNSASKRDIFFRIDKTSYLGIKNYDTVSKTGYGIFIQKFSGNKLIYNIRASNFNWDTAHNTWALQNVVERSMQEITEKVTNSPSKLVNYNFKPLDLRKDEYLKEQMTTPDLDKFITMEKMRGSEIRTLLVERYNRDAIPASVMILTLIGAIMASKKVRGGSGVHLAVGVTLSMLYILFSRFSFVFATQGSLTPFLAAWMPNILFGIIAVYLYYKAPK